MEKVFGWYSVNTITGFYHIHPTFGNNYPNFGLVLYLKMLSHVFDVEKRLPIVSCDVFQQKH